MTFSFYRLRVSTLTHDIDIAVLSVCPYVTTFKYSVMCR